MRIKYRDVKYRWYGGLPVGSSCVVDGPFWLMEKFRWWVLWGVVIKGKRRTKTSDVI